MGESTTIDTRQSERKVILASSLGTIFEWYDFYLYGLLATIISAQFFSGVNETTGFILALAAFAAGFAVRPFGAILFGRIGDLIIGDHLGKPTSWLLAFAYEGGDPAGFACAAGVCRTTLEGGQVLELTRGSATLTSATGEVLGTGVGVHQTALYDMIFATLLFLVLWALSRSPRRAHSQPRRPSRVRPLRG